MLLLYSEKLIVCSKTLLPPLLFPLLFFTYCPPRSHTSFLLHICSFSMLAMVDDSDKEEDYTKNITVQITYLDPCELINQKNYCLLAIHSSSIYYEKTQLMKQRPMQSHTVELVQHFTVLCFVSNNLTGNYSYSGVMFPETVTTPHSLHRNKCTKNCIDAFSNSLSVGFHWVGSQDKNCCVVQVLIIWL